MEQFIVSLIPTALFIWCVHILFQEGHLLENAGKWMEERLPDFVNKPLWMCPICQSSFWGIIGFHALDYFFGVHLPYKLLVLYVLCLCGLNTLLSKLTTKERIIIEDE